jgi:glycine oxidase
MLAPVTEAHIGEEDIVTMNIAAATRWPGFADQLEAASGSSIGYMPCGTLVVAADNSDIAVVERILTFHKSLGLESWRLTARECREVVPGLAPGIRGGASSPSDHQVDNRLLVSGLEDALSFAGVEIVREPVREVSISQGRARGIATNEGREISAGAVLIAAGCWSTQLGGIPEGILPPVRPVKGHILRLRGNEARPLFDRNIRCLVHGSYIYLVPREDGSLVIGATVEEMGYDTRVQAGAVYELLRDARTVVPGIAELELYETHAGLRPGSPDNGPFVGWSPIDGLLVATGHFRNGILLAPITADAICNLLGGGKLPDFLEPFRADRVSPPPRREALG